MCISPAFGHLNFAPTGYKLKGNRPNPAQWATANGPISTGQRQQSRGRPQAKDLCFPDNYARTSLCNPMIKKAWLALQNSNNFTQPMETNRLFIVIAYASNIKTTAMA
ncbi:hypothetical protein EBB79_13825 [Parasedimentitalea marina]|uniref:Uncharacterized protein n=1 Tax=Parasedimentitalea marina TaxID=2483033 RepID=A0A3T0N4D4_9RHOB|nr:hypothetical protein EBB79_13825 [Parasedimentitalea marina]